LTGKFNSGAICLAALATTLAGLVEAAQSTNSAQDVARELANPNTSLGFLAFPIDYIQYKGDLPDAGNQDATKISFQPSFPYPLAKDVNFFLRPLIPVIIDQPVYDGNHWDGKGTDLGDIGFDAAVGRGFANGVQVIGGVAGTLNTATDDDLGLGQTLLGPEFFLGTKTDWGFYGLLVSQQWEVTGKENQSITGGQYFFTYNLENAWQIQMQPTWSYNHEAPSDDAWTLPLGIGISKTIISGKTPWKFSLQYWYFVESPDTFGPDFQIRFQIAPVVPLPW